MLTALLAAPAALRSPAGNPAGNPFGNPFGAAGLGDGPASEGLGMIDITASVSPLLLLAALICFLLAALGALAASTLAVYSPTKLHNRLGEAGRALVDELEEHEDQYRIVARSYFLGGLVGTLMTLQAAVDAATVPWAVTLMSLLALLGCGSLPTAIAEARAEPTLLRLLPSLRVGLWLLRWPLVLPLKAVTGGVLRVLRIREEPSQDPDELAEEVMAAVADSTEDALAAEEKAWIGNIVGLKDLHVSTIMTPRPDLVAIQADTTVRDATRIVQEHGFSRYPVFRDSIDEVVGIFYAKDALGLVAGDAATAEAKVQTMVRPPLFVPESMGVPQLLQRFQSDKMHMAIVLDEYGNTAGVVSFEDVLEQIVGEIDDEYDEQDHELDGVHLVEAGHIAEVPGRTSIDDLNDLLGLSLPDGDWETIAGYVIHHANRIPSADESIEIDGVEFRVLQADGRRIGRLRVTSSAAETADRGRS